jgi:hypothetical protein
VDREGSYKCFLEEVIKEKKNEDRGLRKKVNTERTHFPVCFYDKEK